tara:strand:- start:53 stop:613 length:561 start_codon:yes stop_codon:yes gene_type:complete
MTTVQVLDEGIWFPEIGFALDCLRQGSPSLILSESLLRQMGRKKGVLAPDTVWSRAYPSRKKPRVPVPTDRELRMGKLSIRLMEHWYEPSLVGYSLILRTDNREVLVINPVHEPSMNDVVDELDSEPELIVMGPSTRVDTRLTSTLRTIRTNWPKTSIVLYGAAILEDIQDDNVQVLNPPVQESLL